MNVLKHMEAVFVVMLAVAAAAGYVGAARAPHAQATNDIATPTKMAIVNVTARRPTPAQKLQLLMAERIGASRA
jgi:hypothetical protein